MRHKVTWMRQHDRFSPEVRISYSPGKPCFDIGDLGFEKVCDYPAYDNGKYVVIDTVKDIKWAVLWCKEGGGFVTMRDDFINKYEAMEYADDLLAADERYEE